VEGDQDRHDFTFGQASFSSALAGLDLACLEGGEELLAEVIDVAEQMSFVA
jgi:hypothetical protein